MKDKAVFTKAVCPECGADRSFPSWDDPPLDQYLFCFKCHQEFYFVAGQEYDPGLSKLSKS